ncbi:MAG: 3-deoxy-D-manno-octulosonic acid transferase, partial [Pseudomonadota bacterium]
ERLIAAGATMELADVANLGEEIFGLLSPEKTAALAHAGWSVTTESAYVVEKLAALIDTALDKRELV